MPTLRALITFKGSREEGLISKGDTFEAGPRRARRHIEAGRAERVEDEPAEKQERPEYTDKMERPGYEQKDRSWEGSGSWKTLYEGGEEVEKVQATAEEADAWASGDATLDDIR